VKNADLVTLCNVSVGSTVTIETDSDLVFNGITGVSLVTLCETFLKNN
jgi:hypothetical protein